MSLGNIARKTEYWEYLASSSSLILIYSMDMDSNRELPWQLGVLLTLATLLSTVLCLSLVSIRKSVSGLVNRPENLPPPVHFCGNPPREM